MTLILPNSPDHAPVTAAQFDLLTQIVVRDAEHCYVRKPIADDVRSLVRRGFLAFSEHNGKMVLRPTAAGRLRVALANALE